MLKVIPRAFFINLAVLHLAGQVISGLTFPDFPRGILATAAIFTVFYLLIKPVLELFIRPLTFFLLGLTGLVFDAALLFLLSRYTPFITLSPWEFPGMALFDQAVILQPRSLNIWETTLTSSLAINFLRLALNFIFL